jgi:hypothetical protein
MLNSVCAYDLVEFKGVVIEFDEGYNQEELLNYLSDKDLNGLNYIGFYGFTNYFAYAKYLPLYNKIYIYKDASIYHLQHELNHHHCVTKYNDYSEECADKYMYSSSLLRVGSN